MYKKYLSIVIGTSWLFSFCTPFVHAAVTAQVTLLETPTAILVTPGSATGTVAGTQQFTATAIFSGSPNLDVTCNSLTSWNSNNPAATVNTTDADDGDLCDELAGLATGITSGTVIISATYGGVTGTALFTISSSSPSPTFTPSPGSSGGSSPGAPPPPSPSPSPSPTPTPPPEITPVPSSPELPMETPPALGPPPPGEEEFAPSPQGELPPVSSLPGEEGTIPPSVPPEIPIDVSPQAEFPVIIQTELGPVFIPPELSVTRGEILDRVMKAFDMEKNNEDLLLACKTDLNGCLSIFLSVTQFQDVTWDGINFPNRTRVITFVDTLWSSFVDQALAAPLLDLGKMQLYPDVPPDYRYAYAINIGTLLSLVQGYYEEATSPFKTNQIITRIEAVKVLLGSVGLKKWLYYDELETTLGGIEGIKAQKIPFADVTPTRDFMWWYPRYLTTACEVGMIDCTAGTNFRPDEFITEAELQSMISGLKNYLERSGFTENKTADPDNDGIKTYMEETIYFTHPQNPDTDGDKLNDFEEVMTYKTSPFLKDTDTEGLNDFEEVTIYKTSPLKIDTDDDGYSDSEEVRFNSDPLDPGSGPQDDNGNGIADSWEAQYQVSVPDGTVDTDGDGVSDKIEYQVGSNPLETDSDSDAFTDAEEILQLRSDPLDISDPGRIENIGVRITNFQEYQSVSDLTPLIKGVAPFRTTVRILLRNDYGHEKILGDVSVDENNIFVFQIERPLRDGKYQLVARALDTAKKSIIESKPVHIVIDSTLDVAAPALKKLGDKNISEEVVLKNLRIEIRDRKPVLIGETEFGNKVTATWRSVVTTSVLIADTVNGEFTIAAPGDLILGNHEVFVTASRSKDNAQSDTVRVFFAIGTTFPAVEVLKGAADTGPGSWLSLEFVTTQGPLFWFIVVVIILIIGAGIYSMHRSKKKTQ